MYSRIATLALLLLGYLIAAAYINTWTVMRYAGSRGLPAATTRGMTLRSASRSRSISSTCRFTTCCAAT
jgi:hypothetical protein